MSTAARRSLTITTPSDREIVMTRSFSAPRQIVWNAMTTPALLRRWMFMPPGWTWAACEMDVRIGGKYRWEWNGPDGRPALRIWGVHLEVEEPRRLVHDECMEMGPGAGGCGGGEADATSAPEPWQLRVTLELTESRGQTLLTSTLLCPSRDARDMILASGMEHGVSAGYDTLDQVLASP